MRLTSISVRSARLVARSLTCWLDLLFLRALPLNERWTVVDAASMPTPEPPRDSIRALDAKCLPIVDAREKIKTCA